MGGGGGGGGAGVDGYVYLPFEPILLGELRKILVRDGHKQGPEAHILWAESTKWLEKKSILRCRNYINLWQSGDQYSVYGQNLISYIFNPRSFALL